MRVMGVVQILAVLVTGIGVVATGVLALGTLLSRWFAVSTFEASLVVMAVGWAGIQVLRVMTTLPDLPESEGDTMDQEPAIVFGPLPPPTCNAQRP